VGEADEGNNGLATAPSFIRVVRNLTKFQSASANLSQSSPPASWPLRLVRALLDVMCDAPGAINLSGSFTITSQLAQDATGVADLTGTLNNVPVRNDGALAPFPSPVCIPRTGTTQFDDDPTLIDIFSTRQDLFGPTVPVGTAFRFNVTPLDARFSPQTVVTTLKNPEANTATDYIFIPNSNTPSLRPSGTDLLDARLRQNMTVSWSLPSFAIQEQFFSPIVNIEDGAFCRGNQQNLTPRTTSTTVKFPTTCFGPAPVQAQFCTFFKGDNGESSTGCWFFGEPG
jgi:hypothetical protein